MQPTTLLADPALAAQRPHYAASRRAAGSRRSAGRVPRRLHVRWTWLPLALVLAVAVGGLGYLRVWPPLSTVMSASMTPTINTGDMVVLKRLGRPARIGDIVVVNVPDEARSRYGYPPVVVHRIVKIAGDGTVSTKGDSRKEPDPFTMPRSALVTQVVGTIPAAGRVLAFLSSGLGLLWLAGGVVLMLGLPLLDRYRDAQQREQGEAVDLHASLRAITADLALLREDRLGERDERLDDAARETAAVQDQLRVVTAAFTAQLRQMPAQIERAVAGAVAAIEPPPRPLALVPERRESPLACVPASQWKPPARPVADPVLARAPTPDLLSVFQPAAAPIAPSPRTPSAAATPTWDALPPAFVRGRRHSGGPLGSSALHALDPETVQAHPTGSHNHGNGDFRGGM